MAGHPGPAFGRPEYKLVPAIHVFVAAKTWMLGTRPGMTEPSVCSHPSRSGSVTGMPIRIECSMASVASSVARASCGVAKVQGRPVER
jgi:hypothetical protein